MIRGLLLLLLLLDLPSRAWAQSFDPATVDWERLSRIPMRDIFISQFNEACGSCHGEDLRGLTRGPALVAAPLRHGDSVAEIAASIAGGFPDAGMPAFAQTLRPAEIHNLALYVAEQRQGTTILDKRDSIELALPQGPVRSERHAFRVEVVATGLDPMPFSIAPLPDGRILLTERMRGLRIIERDGTLSPYIRGTPPVYDDSTLFLGQVQGLGWLLEVAVHPDYARNGWVYLHHTDRCSNCNALSRRADGRPVSMNRLVRGRIRDGEWVDEQVLWEADPEAYSMSSDLSAGGRIAFDREGHVYFSVGMKGTMDFTGIQDLDLPYGKVHRLHDDGRIPADNPFVGRPGALGSTWTLGHRSTQGLEINPWTGAAWVTEMGPRGGDELNRLARGGNYGWPVFTSGINYDGRPVEWPASSGSSCVPRTRSSRWWTGRRPSRSRASSSTTPRRSRTGVTASSPGRCARPTCCGWNSRMTRSCIPRCCLRISRASAISSWARMARCTCCWRTSPARRSSASCRPTEPAVTQSQRRTRRQ